MEGSLRALLAPRSVAIVGASADLDKVNGRAIRNMLRDGYAGRILPVNPNYREIAGLVCHPDVASLPEIPELGVVAVAAERAPAALEALGAKGVRAAIVWSAGFAEVGGRGRALQGELLAIARRYGMRLCGPNTLGLTNAFERMPLTFSQYADTPSAPGPVAFVSQSGAFGTAVATAARTRLIGLGYFVSTGNQADVTVAAVVDQVLEDTRIRVVVAYLEGLDGGLEFVAAAAKARRLGKPLIVVKVGRMAAGRRAAVSHTGSLAGDDAVFDSVTRQFGVLRAEDEVHALDLASALVCCPPARGPGVGLITISGGAGAMMADLAEERGLEVPVLGADAQARLGRVLRGFASFANPVDVTGQVVEDVSIVPDSLDILRADPVIGVCVVWVQLLHAQGQRLADRLIEAARRDGAPFVLCWVNAEPEAMRRLREAGVCVIETTRGAIQAAAGLVQYGRLVPGDAASLASPTVPGSKAPAPIATSQPPPRDKPAHAPAAARDGEPPDTGRPVRVVPSMQALERLREAGLSLVPTRLARSAAEAALAAQALGHPVALKIESPDLPHKTEAGGVRLGLGDAAQVRAAFDAVTAAAAAYAPRAAIAGVLVQAMARPGVELVLGVRRDPHYGPIVMVGLGGIFVEVFGDVVFGIPPLSRDDALGMLGRLRGAAILRGVRGRPAIDTDALADALCALSVLAVRHPGIVELDLNPVFADEHGLVAVDWLMLEEPHA